MHTLTHFYRDWPLRPALGLSIALLAAAGLVSAQTPKAAVTNAPAASTNRWQTTAAAGLTLTRGNSSTILATFTLDTKKKWDHNEALLGCTGGYGEDSEVKSSEYANAFGQYNRLFTERFYAGFRTDFSYDGIAELSYRVTVSPLIGYYPIKSTNTSLAFEMGPSVVFEKYENRGQDTFLGFRLGQRFEHKLSATTKIWQSVNYVPQVDRWAEKYLISGEAGIDSSITHHWSLRLVFQNVYDSLPANGRENNDIRLIAGTAYKF